MLIIKKRERYTKKSQTIVCLQCNRIRCVIWIRLVRLCAHCKQRRARKKKISNSNNLPTIISKQLAIHGSCYRLYWSCLRLSFACLHVTLSQAVKTWFRSRFRFNILLRSIVSMCVRVWILCVLEYISLSLLYRIWIEQRNQQPLLQTNSGIFLLNIHDHHQTKK